MSCPTPLDNLPDELVAPAVTFMARLNREGRVPFLASALPLIVALQDSGHIIAIWTGERGEALPNNPAPPGAMSDCVF